MAYEGAQATVAFAFEELKLDEVVAYTAESNVRSRRLMERLGMTRDEADDFEHAKVPLGHHARRHVVYRLRA
ncbi:MAG TPA: GNAT family N-acetyltransferase [Solirubrobacteraceae bacterium]